MTGTADSVEAAVETYNRYRSPMATAELVTRSSEGFTVRFEGPFCTTCCRDDYFDDLRYEFDEVGEDSSRFEIRDVRQTGVETFEVEFAVADP